MIIETPAEQLLYSTVRLEVQGPRGAESGTSFIFQYKHEKGFFLCLVTNKHVIEGTQTGRFFFTKRKDGAPDLGKRLNVGFDGFGSRWFGHPEKDIDIAVMPLKPVLEEVKKLGSEIYFVSLPQDLVPSEEQANQLDALEEVIFVGYPVGLFDTVNLLPVMRRGTTATPIQVDYEGKPIFLIDASVFPGSSGSPVLIYNLGGYGGRKGFTVGTRVYLLGVLAEVVYREEKGTLEFDTIPTSIRPVIRTKEMIDLGLVYKCSAILETIRGLLAALES